MLSASVHSSSDTYMKRFSHLTEGTVWVTLLPVVLFVNLKVGVFCEFSESWAGRSPVAFIQEFKGFSAW